MKKIVKNLEELDNFVYELLRNIRQKETAQIILLSGDLGAGKTAFTKSAAKFFSINEDVTSPTFVIQKEYSIQQHDFFKTMIHIDAYRLESKSELEYLKWSESVQNRENIIFMEWPEQVEGINTPNALGINIKILDNESREISINEFIK